MAFDYKSIVDLLVNKIAPNYLSPDVNKNIVSTFGHIITSQATSINDSNLKQVSRSSNDVIELSNDFANMKAVAKVRKIQVPRAKASEAIFVILLRRDDILLTPKVGEEYQVLIDRKSTLNINTMKFSLNDDILIRMREDGKGDYEYTVSFVGGNEENIYLKTEDMILDDGSPGIGIYINAFQYVHNTATKNITDTLEFQYVGIPFDYDNALAGILIEYRLSSTEEFQVATPVYFRSDETSENTLYYNDDRDGVVYILNNPDLNLTESAEIRVTLLETLGSKGNFEVGNLKTTFSMYNDGSYNYSNITVQAAILTDPKKGEDEISIAELRQLMINNKFGIIGVNENDLVSSLGVFQDETININKRNDLEGRVTYNYTILRDSSKKVIPTRTVDLRLRDTDFDYKHNTSGRKVIKANNCYTLYDSTTTIKVDPAGISIPTYEADVTKLALAMPLMLVINTDNIATYYYNSMDEQIELAYKHATNYKYQFYSQEIRISRNAIATTDDSKYLIDIKTLPNSPDLMGIRDENGNILDSSMLKAYMIIYSTDNTAIAYCKLDLDRFDLDNGTYHLKGSFNTNDYITEMNMLQMSDGLLISGSDTNKFLDVIPYDNLKFDIVYAYKELPDTTTHSSYGIIPELATYTVTNSYTNKEPIKLIKNISSYMQSPVILTEETIDTDPEVIYTLREVPFIKYSYVQQNIPIIRSQLGTLNDVYAPLITNLKDFMVNVKFVSTYGESNNITVQGKDLNNLTPTVKFRIYGKDISVESIRSYILDFFNGFSATSMETYISSLLANIHKDFPIKSIEYLGVDNFDSSHQRFENFIPDPYTMTKDELMKYVPEYLNVNTITIEVKEV